MNILILGAGKVGQALCHELSLDNHDITLLEKDEDRFNSVLNENDIRGVLGNGASYEVQIEAGVEEADIFLAVTENDEMNMIAAVLAKRLGAKNTVARVRNPDYADLSDLMRESLGVNLFINPELQAAHSCVELIEFPLADSIETFNQTQAPIVEMKIQEGFQYIGKTIASFRGHYSNLIVCAIVHKNEVFIPKGEHKLCKGDHLFVTGPLLELIRLYKENGQDNEKISSLFIIGGGKITNYIVKLLEESKVRIKVLEIDEKVADELSENFPKIEVVLADGSNLSTLKEQGARNYDALLALTGIDEENIIISMVAKSLGIKKRVTKINRTELLEIVEEVGLQSIITPKRLIADKIVQYVRALENTQGSSVEALYTIVSDEVEALQFKVVDGSLVSRHDLKTLQIKPNILIAYIIRDNSIIFPTGNDTLKANDRVIVISHQHHLHDIDEILV
ncbi:MAG TPA: Trk system potassium transporter TrkA [Erysipelothrix sp.]|nr:Trk system potassium transporter TrkA [Erysipelothrix sp.]